MFDRRCIHLTHPHTPTQTPHTHAKNDFRLCVILVLECLHMDSNIAKFQLLSLRN